MQSQSANHLPLAVRALALIVAALLLGFGVGELAFGYTYFPARRSEPFFISGTGTLMIAVGALLLSAACLFAVLARSNRYRAARLRLAKTGSALIICSPLVALGVWALREFAHLDLPEYRGFASGINVSIPALNDASWLRWMFDADVTMAAMIGGMVVSIIGVVCAKSKIAGVSKDTALAIGGAGVLLLGSGIALSVVADLASGTTGIGASRGWPRISAAAQPAKFGAAVLIQFTGASVALLLGAAGIGLWLKSRSDDNSLRTP